MSAEEIQELFQKFKSLKVLIVGDVMVDNYIIGKVERISPEAPVPVIDVQTFDSRLGGAGNVAYNIKSLGAIPILCTVIGSDKEGDELQNLLHKSELPDRGIVRSEKRKTTTKTRIIGNNSQIARIDHEIASDIDTLDSYLLEQAFDRELEQADVVIFEDYNKGVLHAENIALLIQKAKKAGVPVIVDPKKNNFFAYKEATLFKPNLKEIKDGLNSQKDLKNTTHLKEAVAQLKSVLNNDITMVTMSELGVFIQSKEEEHIIPAHVRNIADVSGAGDTVVSVAALCLALHTPLKTLAALSNLAGGLVCEETGVVPISKEKLLKEALEVLN